MFSYQASREAKASTKAGFAVVVSLEGAKAPAKKERGRSGVLLPGEQGSEGQHQGGLCRGGLVGRGESPCKERAWEEWCSPTRRAGKRRPAPRRALPWWSRWKGRKPLQRKSVGGVIFSYQASREAEAPTKAVFALVVSS